MVMPPSPLNYAIAYQCALLANTVYQDLADGTSFPMLPGAPVTFLTDPQTDTQLAIITTEEAGQPLGYIVFRGSKGEADWRINLRVQQQLFSLEQPLDQSAADLEERVETMEKAAQAAYQQQVQAVTAQVVADRDLTYPKEYAESSRPVKMHSGFMQAYLSVRDQIHQVVQQSGITQWRITGHSLGGALAILCGLDLQYNFDHGIQVYTFGAPKVGNADFVASYNGRVPESWRLVYGWDIVAKLPRWWQGRYQHVNHLIPLKRGFSLRVVSGSVRDHRMANYVATLNKLAHQATGIS